MTRTLVIYHGRVQGVGFRYTAVRIARRYAVAGVVQNQPDGTVRLEAEGAADDLDAFLQELQDAMARHIQHVDRHTLEPTGAFGHPAPGGLKILR
ncbi:MAG: acylphosphatase [Planctomycetota bacterium]